jgi:uncharacterized protein (TIGR00251 family)
MRVKQTNGSILQVKVKPNARENRLTESKDGVWLASIKALPVDGKANEALIELVAGHFKVRRRQVSIAAGSTSRLKRLFIEA